MKDVKFSTHNNTPQDCNTFATNGITYYTSNGPATSIGATTTDGALYMQKYSDAWQAQIAQDYRNGGLFVRGKNNGTWQSWQKVYDTGHKPTPSEIGAAASSHSHSYLPLSGGSLTGSVDLSTAGTGSYNQGLRINRVGNDYWATLTIGTANASTSNMSDYGWLIGSPPTSNGRKLLIQHCNADTSKTGFFAEKSGGATGLLVAGPLRFRTVINSNTGNGTINLTQAYTDFTHMRIYFYTTNGYYSSMVLRTDAPTWTLDSSAALAGSPNKLWTATKTVSLSGKTISLTSTRYSELGINSSNAFGVNANNAIYINKVEAWNE